MRATVRRLLSEPFVHFAFLGAFLFALHGWSSTARAASPQDVRVTAGDVENLAFVFSRTWQRMPTSEELKGLVDDFVREEILSREAIRLGLDRDDNGGRGGCWGPHGSSAGG